MDTLAYVEDILPLVAFAVAVVMVMRIPQGDDNIVSRGAKYYLLASVGVYLIGTIASVLKRVGVWSQGSEDVIYSIELLWGPFILFAVYSLYSRQRLLDSRKALRDVRGTGDLMARVVEAAPAGILVIDPTGHVTFANEAARSMLELGDDGDDTFSPMWTMHVADRAHVRESDRTDLSGLVTTEPMTDVNVVLNWPDGTRRRFTANTAPALGPDGSVAGAVVSFMESAPWLKARG